MARYHFHDADGVRQCDEDGIELPDDEAARVLAARYAGDMLKHEPRKVWDHGQWRVEVTDDSNILLFTVVMVAIDAPRARELRDG